MPNIAPETPLPPAAAARSSETAQQVAAQAVARFELLLRLVPRSGGCRSARLESDACTGERRPDAPEHEPERGDNECLPPGEEGTMAAVGTDVAQAVRRQRDGGRGAGREQGAAGAAADGATKRRVSATDAVAGITPESEQRFDMDRIADRIQNMFRCATGGMDSWQVTLDLHDQLPETLLRIRASRTWLGLRFSTQSAESVRLLSRHMPELEQSLSAKLDMQYQINVDLE